ncbi:MAG: lasso peptide biosynthesis B2 protein [Alphaproteobacteria bacterium]|nr:lasso peptide biosynthesis B2 protein [Alphaproteobacteria bacterium]MBU1525178.1 lasso peptide biosynthesis B2 protein [Alphaproteobacteria bacterium]MBU2117468.1 lasso peptide biosynthesis B2 protein [Alphaproteobacteria bacterium]MBU2352174.1 lasso peptide biosynthesis B2 protein [Alphaproteobacteria bacterium]MBU2381184.1 lasso peptide biosynthesis B2 protein [Alphaproteobacteria bacterium]
MRMTHAQRVLLVEATVWLALARVSLLVLPFRTVAAHLGEACAPAVAAGRIGQPGGAPQEVETARAVGWAVRLMADALPFRAVCLQQGVAAKMMLRRRGIPSVLHFGVAPDAAGLNPHAWLDTADARVTGYPVGDRFTELACWY